MKENVKTDCFAFKDNHCDCLDNLYCESGKCSFYQTKEELEEKNEKVLKRKEELENEIC